MGWKSFALSLTTTALVACASIAGIERPDESTKTVDPIQAEKKDGELPSQGDNDAATAAETSPTSTPPAQADSGSACFSNNHTCESKDDCCSTKCGNRHKCVTSCGALGSVCTVWNGDDCCVGTYCGGISGFSFICAPCIQTGNPSDGDATHCCSGATDGGKCK